MSKKFTPLKAWSYSRYKDHDTCPKKLLYKHILKVPEDETPAMLRGQQAHKDLAAYLNGEGPAYVPYTPAPIPGWTYFAPMLHDLRNLEPIVEQQWGFTNRWKPTGWFGDSTWLRVVMDAAVIYDFDNTADVIDFKTGKPYPDHAEQSEIYALAAFCRYPELERVTVRFWYVDMEARGEESVFRYSEKHIPRLIQKWEEKAERVLTERIFAAHPGRHCNWCPFARSKGGPCKHG